jgi:acetyl-CoA carboxylase carboxyltransferase component
VTGFARIDGRPVGVIANQPRYLGGVLDAASSEKGARFVSKCNAFGIPLVVLVDTPGSCPAPSRRRPA